jgi:GNAT superfamily N-acetyltransferase
MTSIEIRVLGSTGIEDHHAHLLRLDPAVRELRLAAGSDDSGIDGHCLRLIGSQAVLIGAYCDRTLRAGLEIIPDRTAREAEAIFTAEPAFNRLGIARMLIARMFDEARRYRLTRLSLRGFDDIALLDRMAEAHFVEIEPGSPLRLCFAPALPAAPAQSLTHSYA